MTYEICSRREAADAGKSKYFTDQPCKHGHVAQRYVASGICVVCNRKQRSRYLPTAKTDVRLVLTVHKDDTTTIEALANAMATARRAAASDPNHLSDYEWVVLGRAADGRGVGPSAARGRLVERGYLAPVDGSNRIVVTPAGLARWEAKWNAK
jgi:hypothetical protein